MGGMSCAFGCMGDISPKSGDEVVAWTTFPKNLATRWLLFTVLSDIGKNSPGTTRFSPNTISTRETCNPSLGGPTGVGPSNLVRYSMPSAQLSGCGGYAPPYR